MANPKLLRGWAQTESYLREARSHVSQVCEAQFSSALADFEEFLEHNELGLAFDTLCSVAEESQRESTKVFELLALSAASMGLLERQQELDEYIFKLTGARHESHLSPPNA